MDKDKPILVALNERILFLENEILQADLLLDELRVPAQSKSGRDLSISGRLQWVLSYANRSLSARILDQIMDDKDKPLFFSRN